MTNLISCKNLSLALLFVTGGAWAAADKYWIAENGAGNWGDANWATSTDGVGSAFDSGKTALFHQPLNNIDLSGGLFTVWTFRPKSGEYSTDNRYVVNICNTCETEATLTFKDFGDNAENIRNMVVTLPVLLLPPKVTTIFLRSSASSPKSLNVRVASVSLVLQMFTTQRLSVEYSPDFGLSVHAVKDSPNKSILLSGW